LRLFKAALKNTQIRKAVQAAMGEEPGRISEFAQINAGVSNFATRRLPFFAKDQKYSVFKRLE